MSTLKEVLEKTPPLANISIGMTTGFCYVGTPREFDECVNLLDRHFDAMHRRRETESEYWRNNPNKPLMERNVLWINKRLYVPPYPHLILIIEGIEEGEVWGRKEFRQALRMWQHNVGLHYSSDKWTNFVRQIRKGMRA